jgi:beta-aspartyl-peptidase (threonine type)
MQRPAIIVHGGAGSWAATETTEDVATIGRAAEAGCRAAAEVGAEILAAGGVALDAVEAAVRALEDDTTFNAGYGAVLTREGTVELDALIVDGVLRAGAVGALSGHRHPISIARRLLERGHHVFLVAEGARRFAAEEGFLEEPLEALISPRARARHLARSVADTVGAVAVDANGHLAAAASTGGTAHKRVGRIGDSPIIGAGAFADDRSCAVTATGHGESIMRMGLSRTVAERVLAGDPIEVACRVAIGELTARTTGTAGLIAIDINGHVAHATSTPQMPWAAWFGGVITSGLEP